MRQTELAWLRPDVRGKLKLETAAVGRPSADHSSWVLAATAVSQLHSAHAFKAGARRELMYERRHRIR